MDHAATGDENAAAKSPLFAVRNAEKTLIGALFGGLDGRRLLWAEASAPPPTYLAVLRRA